MTEYVPPEERPNPQPAPTSPGRQAWEQALQQMEIEQQLLRLQVDHARATSPDKETFAINALAAVYPLGRSIRSAEVVEELRTQYYLYFSGKTLAAYGQYLQDYDAHDSN